MSRIRLLLTPCLSAALAAGAFVSPAFAQSPQIVTLKDFSVQPTELYLPFGFFPVGVHFEAERDTVAFLCPGAGNGCKITDTVIVPGGSVITSTFEGANTHPWSQALGKAAAFTFQVSAQEILLKDDEDDTLLSLVADHPFTDAELSALSVPPTFALTNEQGSLTVTQRVLTTSGEKDRALGSEPISILGLTYAANQGTSNLEPSQLQVMPQMGSTLPKVLPPAASGTYDLAYRNAQGSLVRETLADVRKLEGNDLNNSSNQPYEVTEHDIDENGKPAGGERTYFVGKPDQPENTAPPENLHPPIRHPSPPPSFRLTHGDTFTRTAS